MISWRSFIPNQRGVYIFDADVVDRLVRVEGARWRDRAEDPANVYGVAWKVDAWNARQADEVYGDVPFSDYAALGLGGQTVIYGEGGYTRYQVRNDGEVVLLGTSATPAQRARAEGAGIKVATR